ncbi:Cytochrome c oxidase assembly factor 4 homolog, mitochondrial [Eumeta japonica]|uniref:Cytochrome c oxidase assembly factor 4 homolog, mitochondrial n=1 Tax=Eumeta variegata TaxID=151549 RepID=A0A4C1SVQ0_EUMVA|nr:Cytochrome c oxidase assembly factor 4 homolog, mitochondrial [Eumeta japonica]
MTVKPPNKVTDSEEDPVEVMLKKTGCIELHYKVQECIAMTQDWRKCQNEVNEFRSCMNKHQQEKNRKSCAAAVSLLHGRVGRWSGREIARSALSLARSAQAERGNESCFFVRAAGVHRSFYYHYGVKLYADHDDVALNESTLKCLAVRSWADTVAIVLQFVTLFQPMTPPMGPAQVACYGCQTTTHIVHLLLPLGLYCFQDHLHFLESNLSSLVDKSAPRLQRVEYLSKSSGPRYLFITLLLSVNLTTLSVFPARLLSFESPPPNVTTYRYQGLRVMKTETEKTEGQDPESVQNKINKPRIEDPRLHVLDRNYQLSAERLKLEEFYSFKFKL